MIVFSKHYHEVHLTDEISIVIQIVWKFCVVLIPILAQYSLQGVAHDKTGSCIVVCAKFGNDLMTRNGVKSKRVLLQVWSVNNQNGRHFADDIFKCIFLDEIFWISYNISFKCVCYGLNASMSSLLQIMVTTLYLKQRGSNLLAHIRITRPQRVNEIQVGVWFNLCVRHSSLYRASQFPIHNDIIKWKQFPLYRTFVRGIHRSPVTQSFDVSFYLRLNKRFNKQPRSWWFKTP